MGSMPNEDKGGVEPSPQLWVWVEAFRRHRPGEFAAARLAQDLRAAGAEAIAAFEADLDRAVAALDSSDRRDLLEWAGFSGDDAFDAICHDVVVQGEQVWRAAIRDREVMLDSVSHDDAGYHLSLVAWLAGDDHETGEPDPYPAEVESITDLAVVVDLADVLSPRPVRPRYRPGSLDSAALARWSGIFVQRREQLYGAALSRACYLGRSRQWSRDCVTDLMTFLMADPADAAIVDWDLFLMGALREVMFEADTGRTLSSGVAEGVHGFGPAEDFRPGGQVEQSLGPCRRHDAARLIGRVEPPLRQALLACTTGGLTVDGAAVAAGVSRPEFLDMVVGGLRTIQDVLEDEGTFVVPGRRPTRSADHRSIYSAQTLAANVGTYIDYLHAGHTDDVGYQEMLRDPRTQRQMHELEVDRQIVNELWFEPLAPPVDEDPVLAMLSQA